MKDLWHLRQQALDPMSNQWLGFLYLGWHVIVRNEPVMSRDGSGGIGHASQIALENTLVPRVVILS
jgi:hypothetical protein